jgi:pimeloyl-ACP methyl ester carboxylesterase
MISVKNKGEYHIMQKKVSLGSKSIIGYLMIIIICWIFLIVTAGTIQAQTQWPHVIPSKDGTAISYEDMGSGEPALIFVHGWSCDARYWRAQLPHFSKKHRVVILDLAGHGHSGMTRDRYTMAAFGEDVKAVVEAAGIRKAVLIGHSMGGSVIAEAARLMPDRVLGLIGVDTLENIEYPMTQEEFKKIFDPFEKDFQTAGRQFISAMIYPETDQRLREWILADMSSGPKNVALSAMNEMMTQYITGEAAKVFKEIRIPVVTVNGDLWPVNYEANRRHMFSYDAIILKKADHFLMMDRPAEFNRALTKAIKMISAKSVKKKTRTK